MKFHDFLAHHGVTENPFSVEDAQTDTVFKDRCIDTTFHPAWDKVFGDPSDPSTAIVFGEKGAGKTALRLQMRAHITRYNQQHPHRRCFVISYDDFNPFLDQFRERCSRRQRPERVLRDFHLWDHIDAILSLGVTRLLDRLFLSTSTVHEDRDLNHGRVAPDYRKRLRAHQRRDLLLLAACYDHSSAASPTARWHRLQRRLHAWNVSIWWPFAVGLTVTVALIAAIVGLCRGGEASVLTNLRDAMRDLSWLFTGLFVASWLPWLVRSVRRAWLAWGIKRNVRVLARKTIPLARVLMSFSADQLANQPLPNKQRTDDRYALLAKFQSILQALDFGSVVVLVDRIDEPHFINGSPALMKELLWPMLDNKFLKQPGLALKFMLPQELSQFISRETQDFYQRARLDKQNVVPSLAWTGEALYDLINARLAACSHRNPPARLTDLVDESITERRLFDALQSLRVPRHAFKFLYRAISTHVNQHSQEAPAYRLSANTFESELAVYRREQEAADQGLAAG